MKSIQKGSYHQGVSAAVVVLVAVIVLVSGGVAAYLLTDGFGVNKPENAAVHEGDQAESPQKNSNDDVAAKLPDWFEPNYPVYPGSTIKSVSTAGTSGQAYIVGTQSSKSGEDVAEWYHDQYAAEGWIKDNVDSEKRFNATKQIGDHEYAVVVNVNSVSSATVVTITASRL